MHLTRQTHPVRHALGALVVLAGRADIRRGSGRVPARADAGGQPGLPVGRGVPEPAGLGPGHRPPAVHRYGLSGARGGEPRPRHGQPRQGGLRGRHRLVRQGHCHPRRQGRSRRLRQPGHGLRQAEEVQGGAGRVHEGRDPGPRRLWRAVQPGAAALGRRLLHPVGGRLRAHPGPGRMRSGPRQRPGPDLQGRRQGRRAAEEGGQQRPGGLLPGPGQPVRRAGGRFDRHGRRAPEDEGGRLQRRRHPAAGDADQEPRPAQRPADLGAGPGCGRPQDREHRRLSQVSGPQAQRHGGVGRDAAGDGRGRAGAPGQDRGGPGLRTALQQGAAGGGADPLLLGPGPGADRGVRDRPGEIRGVRGEWPPQVRRFGPAAGGTHDRPDAGAGMRRRKRPPEQGG